MPLDSSSLAYGTLGAPEFLSVPLKLDPGLDPVELRRPTGRHPSRERTALPQTGHIAGARRCSFHAIAKATGFGLDPVAARRMPKWCLCTGDGPAASLGPVVVGARFGAFTRSAIA